MAYEGSALRLVPGETSAQPAPLTADRWARLDGDPACYAIHMDARGDLLGVSQALCRRLGFAPADLAGAPVAALLHPDHRRTADTHRILVGRTGELVELEFTEHPLPEGDALWLAPAPGLAEGGEDARPDTAPVADPDLRHLLDHLTDAILLLDNEGRVRYLNRAAADLLGTESGALGEYWQSLFTGTEDAEQLVGDCLAGGSDGERSITLGTGSRLHRAALACSPLHGGDGAVIRLAVGRGPGLDEEILYRARHDAVTGLHNRWEFETRLAEQLRRGTPGSLALVDLDRFKAINDHAGHAAGDALLRRVAGALTARLRTGDELARVGGDEFALLLRECEPGAAAERLRTTLIDLMAEPFCFDGRAFAIGFSAGIAPLTGDDPDTVLAAADRACYRAKTAGRGRVTVATQAVTLSG